MRMDQEKLDRLRKAYNLAAPERENRERDRWKMDERRRFLSLVLKERVKHILEIGSGTGWDSLYFKEHGLDVHCIDLSEENVALCRQKGLSAEVMDITRLTFDPAEFEGVFTFNCLLHVPMEDFNRVLKQIREIMKPGGLFYLGQYGGIQSEGVWAEDYYQPKRFFSFLLDEQIQEICARFFHIRVFRTLQVETLKSLHFQSLILEKTEN
jgi:SAM-dependent methyltransferase